ncbi:hypothetical protein RRG08_066513 [Elysia crispata]|uniref:Uncharacterized protein n=1 Tax=Elysia crispata TaxID=231223 RepID=A0AAE0ZLP5_9GAST|nr:hypothetical protein RRG08_066513 [Elysia crispata]
MTDLSQAGLSYQSEVPSLFYADTVRTCGTGDCTACLATIFFLHDLTVSTDNPSGLRKPVLEIRGRFSNAVIRMSCFTSAWNTDLVLEERNGIRFSFSSFAWKY